MPGHFSPQVTFELARDYLAAGLLDRAEALFHQLMDDRGYGERAAAELIELYQQEKEWGKAAQVARTLMKSRLDPQLARQLAYITCELADDCLHRDDRWGTQKLVREALSIDANCVRASFILSTLQARQRTTGRRLISA